MHYYVVGLPISKETPLPRNGSESKQYFPKGNMELFWTQSKAKKEAKRQSKDNKRELKKAKKSNNLLKNIPTKTLKHYPIFKIECTAANKSITSQFINAETPGINILKIYIDKKSINFKNQPSLSNVGGLNNPQLTNTPSSFWQNFKRPLFLVRGAIFIASVYLYFQHSIIKTKDELLYYGIIPNGNAWVGVPLLLGIVLATAYTCVKIFDGIMLLSKRAINSTKRLFDEKSLNSVPAVAPAPAAIVPATPVVVSGTAAPEANVATISLAPKGDVPATPTSPSDGTQKVDLEPSRTLVFSRITPPSGVPKKAAAPPQNTSTDSRKMTRGFF